MRVRMLKSRLTLPMKYLVALLCLQSVFAQPAAPPIPKLPDDAVLAEFDDGVKFTMADF